MFDYIFKSPYDQYKHKNDIKCRIIKTVNTEEEPDPACDPEVGPMHIIEFEDGEIIRAWPEELEPAEAE